MIHIIRQCEAHSDICDENYEIVTSQNDVITGKKNKNTFTFGSQKHKNEQQW